MEENPYESPMEFESPPVAIDKRWHPFTWAVIGFSIGTFIASLFVLSHDRVGRAIAGAIFGGIPTGLYSFMSVAERRRKEAEQLSRD